MKHAEIITAFETYLLTERRVAKNTFDAYMRDLKQFFIFLDTHNLLCIHITLHDLKNYLAFLKNSGVTARTMSRKISCLKTLGNYLKTRWSIRIPTEQLILPKLEQKLPEYLTEQEVVQLLTCADQETSDAGIRNKVMLYVLYGTGIRVSELVHITLSAVNFDEGFIVVAGKGNKERFVPLPESVIHMLKEYVQTTRVITLGRLKHSVSQSQILFPVYYDGALKALSRQAFWNYVKDVAQRAGLSPNLSPHQLRHSLATHLLKQGANLRSLQLLLGHEQLSTVQIYTHVEVDHLRKIYDKKHPRS